MTDAAAPADLVNATFRLVRNGDLYPELREAEHNARLRLAAAIMQMDAAPDPAIQEQAHVEECTRVHWQALANLVRGDTP